MVQFAGNYKHDKDENLEAILNKQGFNIVLRKILSNMHPSVDINIDGNNWTMVTDAAIKTMTHTFTIGEEAELEGPAGKKQKVLITLEGNTMRTKVLSGDKKDMDLVRIFSEDGFEQVMTHTPSGTVGKRYFKRV